MRVDWKKTIQAYILFWGGILLAVVFCISMVVAIARQLANEQDAQNNRTKHYQSMHSLEAVAAKFKKNQEQEAQELEKEQLVEKATKFVELLTTPETTTVAEIVAYLPSELYKENLLWMARAIDVEAGSCSDEMQQLVGMVQVARAIHPGGKDFSDGSGSIKTVLFWNEYGILQYPWAHSGHYPEQPSESAIRNAQAVLNGDVIDTQMTINVLYQGLTPLGSGIYKELIGVDGSTEYFCYE